MRSHLHPGRDATPKVIDHPGGRCWRWGYFFREARRTGLLTGGRAFLGAAVLALCFRRGRFVGWNKYLI